VNLPLISVKTYPTRDVCDEALTVAPPQGAGGGGAGTAGGPSPTGWLDFGDKP